MTPESITEYLKCHKNAKKLITVRNAFGFILTPIHEQSRSFPIHVHFCEHGNFNKKILKLLKCILKALIDFGIKVKFLSFDGDPTMYSLFVKPAVAKIIKYFMNS